MTRNTLTTTADIFDGVPVSDTKSRRVGFWIVFVTFGLFGTWAAFAPLDSAAYAPGVVTVQSYRKTVQHLEGGIVKDVLAHDGDIVKKGDPLIVLDDAQLKAEYETTYSQLIAAKAMEARLRAERDGATTIDFGVLLPANTPVGKKLATAKLRYSMPVAARV